MPKLIKDGRIHPEAVLSAPTLAEYVQAPQGDHVLVQGDESPELLQPFMDQLRLILINIPNFNDGRGFSLATLLRQRFGYTHEIRAVGDILPDICYHLHHCGFDSFQIPDHYSAEDALRCMQTFSHPYQGTQRTHTPWFRRKAS